MGGRVVMQQNQRVSNLALRFLRSFVWLVPVAVALIAVPASAQTLRFDSVWAAQQACNTAYAIIISQPDNFALSSGTCPWDGPSGFQCIVAHQKPFGSAPVNCIPDYTHFGVEPDAPADPIDHDRALRPDCETCAPSPSPACSGTSCGNPINVATGNKHQREVDIGGPGPAFARYYNSYFATRERLGLGPM